MFATTTKICTADRSSRARARAFSAIGAPAYSNGHSFLRHMFDLHVTFDGARARRSSAIHFQGRSIRQVSRYTLLGGCRLPWPPSCCLYRSTPFVGSDERRVGRLVSAFGSSRIASPAYQEWPTRRGNLFLPTRPRPAFVRSARASFHSSKARAPHFLSFANLKFENRSRTFRPRSDRHQSSTSNRSLYQTRLANFVPLPAILRETSAGTSYQKVRLVFRPHA